MVAGMSQRLPRILATSPVVTRAVLTALAMLLTLAAISYHRASQSGGGVFVDFHAFHVAGSLALEGHAADAYRMATMEAAQQRMTGTTAFMPWTYPPPFTLFVAGLASLPLGLSYALFAGLTLTSFVLVLRRIAGDHLPGVLLAMAPVLALGVMTGQNGFLTGALTGWFLTAFLARKPGAGLPLGLMVIKPHLAAGIALLTLAERRGRVIMVAAAVVAAALIVPTLVFGPAIWTAFADGVRESGAFLADGRYPMFRMTSLYAFALSLGLPAGAALLVQALGACAAIGLLLLAWRNRLSPHRLAASACAASLFVSPYCYDYDLCLLGLAIAFILPDLLARTRAWEQVALLTLCWAATGYGFAASYLRDGSAVRVDDQPVSLLAPLLLILIGWSIAVLRRQDRVPEAKPSRNPAAELVGYSPKK